MYTAVSTPDGPMDLYVALPDHEPRGGIVVIQEAFGVTTHIESVCDLLAAAGHVAVAPELFHRQDPPHQHHTMLSHLIHTHCPL